MRDNLKSDMRHESFFNYIFGVKQNITRSNDRFYSTILTFYYQTHASFEITHIQLIRNFQFHLPGKTFNIQLRTCWYTTFLAVGVSLGCLGLGSITQSTLSSSPVQKFCIVL